MINLYIDFDGVILDTISITYKEIDKRGIKSQDEVLAFYKELDWKELLQRVPDKYNSVNSIKNIIASDLFNVAILTHITSLNEAKEKVKFINKYLKGITIITVPKELSKTELVDPKDSILIDDYTENLREWEKAGGVGVRFSTKLNGKGFKCIDRLDQIIDMLDIVCHS